MCDVLMGCKMIEVRDGCLDERARRTSDAWGFVDMTAAAFSSSHYYFVDGPFFVLDPHRERWCCVIQDNI